MVGAIVIVSNRSKSGAGQLVMVQLGLITIGSGAAAALLFASVTTGSLLSTPLFYLAPLPIMIVGIGWSHWAALIATMAAALALGIAFGGVLFLVFLGGVGAPSWWLSYLMMLARPVTANSGAGAPIQAPMQDMNANRVALREWYPPGRLVIWAAVLAALLAVAAIPSFGFDAESFRAGLRQVLARMLQIDSSSESNQPFMGYTMNPQQLLDFLVEVVPLASAIVATLTNLFNLWLAARIVQFSGRLSRPWSALSEMTFPKTVLIALAVTAALSFVGGLVGIIAAIFSASFLIIYGVLGFAVMHDITRGIASRSFLLAGLYATTLVFDWPILILCLIGLAEAIFDLRARVRNKRGPPSKHM
jgi:hypothetical protein